MRRIISSLANRRSLVHYCAPEFQDQPWPLCRVVYAGPTTGGLYVSTDQPLTCQACRQAAQ
jgi:hypothetical protein